MMAPWGFVALAYGIVWGVIAGYWYVLKRRYRAAAAELARLNAGAGENNKKDD
jgi:hypothetical protein